MDPFERPTARKPFGLRGWEPIVADPRDSAAGKKQRDELPRRSDACLFVDGFHVGMNRLVPDLELLCDLLVGKAVQEAPGDRGFHPGQVEPGAKALGEDGLGPVAGESHDPGLRRQVADGSSSRRRFRGEARRRFRNRRPAAQAEYSGPSIGRRKQIASNLARLGPF
jgi:hypothetical protein